VRNVGWGLLALLFASSLVVCWRNQDELLREAGKRWIVSDSLTLADAIIVLGGNPRSRPSVGARIYKAGFASRILISRTVEGPEVAAGANRSDVELSRAAILRERVPSEVVEEFGERNASTRDEAVAVRKWVERNNAKILIIPTEGFNARRVRWIFQRVLSDLPVIIKVISFDPSDFPPEEWWKTEEGLMSFRTEVIKYIYYRVVYCC
jgi:uncharacterized SAM-binding protein YcdF (DUF218 family)